MKIILPILLVIAYWSIDAYQAMLNFNITYKQAFLLDYTQANYLVKFIIVALIFISSVLLNKTKSNVIQKVESEFADIDTIYKISDALLSPVPLHKQLNKVVSIMEEKLDFETAFVGSYEKDTILLLNTNESLQKVGIKAKYLPHQDILLKNTLEDLLSKCFLENRGADEKNITINNTTYRVIVQIYKNHSKTSMGIVALVLNKNNNTNYTNFISKVCEQISFTINLTKQREDAIKAQNQYNAQFSSIDPDLNIPNISKLQNMIEHEIKRSQRYGTQLSLIIIQIDHIKNLTNIFSEQETKNLKKEVVTLLKREVRETDLFGKWKDDNFAIVAPDIEYRAAKGLANKLTKTLREHRFSKVGKITCSYGITSFSHKDTIGEFRIRAENALKVAVEHGGNSIEVKILV